ncbi:protein bag-of-marbles [Scaptodrosophila lebanonensis]|uniref:Protein bag-of-marbles n=1 Tax=Drosophila lebanonensis TaxID=7225 RepID=A0A6J2TGM0_DROLE|nr:protein bag-of-marbles [Scaptodrosophila lebanonensis]
MNENATECIDFTDSDDIQLSLNMQHLSTQLISLTEGVDEESSNVQSQRPGGSSKGVLAQLKRNFAELNLDANAPVLEFHGYGCLNVLPKHSRAFVGNKKHAQSGGDIQSHEFVARQNSRQQQQLQELNVWINPSNGEEEISMEKLKSIGLHCDGVEHNPVMRLMNLFCSLHDHLNSQLPSSQMNALPSDYLFDWPKKCTLPKSINVRHQVMVLVNKCERFLGAQRRVLESNRHFDLVKYNECDDLLCAATAWTQLLRQFSTVEMRHFKGKFVNSKAKACATQLEEVMLKLRESIRAAYINIFVFNWEMDQEHRYSLAMTESRETTNKFALEACEDEKQAASQSPQMTPEEQFLAEVYQLENVLMCAKEFEDTLNALIQMPENYFPPEIVAQFNTKNKATTQLDGTIGGEYELWADVDIIEVPTSPPKISHRRHYPQIYRG